MIFKREDSQIKNGKMEKWHNEKMEKELKIKR